MLKLIPYFQPCWRKKRRKKERKKKKKKEEVENHVW